MDALTWAVVLTIAAAAGGVIALVLLRHRVATGLARRRTARHARRERARRQRELERLTRELNQSFERLAELMGEGLLRETQRAVDALQAFAEAMEAARDSAPHGPRPPAHRPPPKQKVPTRRDVAHLKDHARRRGA